MSKSFVLKELKAWTKDACVLTAGRSNLVAEANKHPDD